MATLFLCYLFIDLFCWDPSVPIFCFKIICQPSIRLLDCPRNFSSYLQIYFLLLFCLYCLVVSKYLFSLPYFASNFWFIFSSCIFCCSCVAFSSFSQRMLIYFFLYWLVHFQHFKVRKPTFLNYCPKLAGEPSVCCLKSK